jgi:hypothetical protein
MGEAGHSSPRAWWDTSTERCAKTLTGPAESYVSPDNVTNPVASTKKKRNCGLMGKHNATYATMESKLKLVNCWEKNSGKHRVGRLPGILVANYQTPCWSYERQSDKTAIVSAWRCRISPRLERSAFPEVPCVNGSALLYVVRLGNLMTNKEQDDSIGNTSLKAWLSAGQLYNNGAKKQKANGRKGQYAKATALHSVAAWW